MTHSSSLVFLLILLLNGAICANDDSFTIGPTIAQQLHHAHRNAQCCAKRMRCCKKAPPPNIEIRAVIARCTKPPFASCRKRFMKEVLNEVNEHAIKKFQGFDEDEPLAESVVTKCNQKVILTLKIKNEGLTNTKSQMVVVDHVYDPVSSRIVRLLNPYVIKLRQEHVSQTYGLKFVDFINSNAREQVYNKHDGNYTGCRTDLKNPTCGLVKYRGKVIPYSQGFCCSCDAQKNAERQPGTVVEKDPLIEQSDPAYLFDAVQCPRTYVAKNHEGLNKTQENETTTRRSKEKMRPAKKKHRKPFLKSKSNTATKQKSERNVLIEDDLDDTYDEKLINTDGQSIDTDSFNKMQNINDQYDDVAFNNENKYSKSRGSDNEYFTSTIAEKLHKNDRDEEDYEQDYEIEDHDIKKRQVQSSGLQKRGGQNCADRYTPPHLNPESYHESAHCLRFSPVWYGVYKINKPTVEQEVVLQIFEKYETVSGDVQWKDITNGKKVKLGTLYKSYQDDVPTVSLNYESVAKDFDFCLDYNKYRLLMPEGIKESDVELYPEARGGPSEYLIFDANQIFVSGDQCNTAGVGFEAFYNQPNRCSMPRGSCLHHQPKHLWLHDKRMEVENKPGCYFLKHYGNLAKDPMQINPTTNEKFLTLNYYGGHESIIGIEINADFNAVLRPQSRAVISEVYIDSTRSKQTFLTIKVINAGLLASMFMVRISDCPLDIQGKLKEVTSKLILISPQNQNIFKLNMSNDFGADLFFCSVEALDVRKEIVALRRIRIQISDRCICTWHCLCACIGSSQGLKCIPMRVAHYQAAGFHGGLPIVSHVQHLTLIDDVITLLFYVFLFILFTLFVLGLTKAIMGLCFLPVGMWGINILLDLPKPMNKYYERNLRKRQPVIYDGKGWPIHPDTKERVRNIPRIAEFCTNVLFFFTYPCIVLLLLFRRVCCPLCSKQLLKKKKRSKDFCEYQDSPRNPKEDVAAENKMKKQEINEVDQKNATKKNKPKIKVVIKEHRKGSPPKSPPDKSLRSKQIDSCTCSKDKIVSRNSSNERGRLEGKTSPNLKRQKGRDWNVEGDKFVSKRRRPKSM